MFKKLLKAGMTFALLAGCYVVYVHAFDIAVQQLETYRVKDKGRFTFKPSRSKVQAIALAKSAFSPDHWSVTNDQPYAYYNSSAASGCTSSSSKRSRKRTASATMASGSR